ncbi:MAG: YaiI/YqxD family protein [Desulfobulbaceae bacterium]|nr:YaiI/YqxD family protein [Desulfobulbaceae bacterium]
MKIWVDADACPVVIKEILFKAAERTRLELILVANRSMRIPHSSYISFIRVGAGFDVADSEIVNQMEKGDLVITSDIPLAALVVEKDGLALNPRGELYSAEDIRSRLSTRDFMESLRESGVETGGPPPLNANDRQRFSNQLDRLLTRYGRKG